jgi:hypothetical protein
MATTLFILYLFCLNEIFECKPQQCQQLMMLAVSCSMFLACGGCTTTDVLTRGGGTARCPLPSTLTSATDRRRRRRHRCRRRRCRRRPPSFTTVDTKT